jgi:hypothetical protein
MVESKLKDGQPEGLILQALYIIVNVATGNRQQKDLITSTKGILNLLKSYLVTHHHGLISVATYTIQHLHCRHLVCY